MMGYNETFRIAIVCQIVDLMDRKLIKNKTYMQFAFDLSEITHKLLTRLTDKDESNLGPIYS